MHGRLLGLVGFALGLAAPVSAQTIDPFEALVQKLGHPRYAERVAAARALEAVGEPALKAVRAAMTSGDEELRTRATVVVEAIETAVRSRQLLTAPRLSLAFDKTPLDVAIVAFNTKTGLQYSLDPALVKNPKRPINLSTGDLPYWEAVQAFLRAADLTENDAPPTTTTEQPGRVIYSKGLDRRVAMAGVVRLMDGPPSPLVVTDRAIRVRVLPATHTGNKFDAAKGELTFHLDIDAAPSLHLQEVIGVDVRRAVGGDRTVLAAAYPTDPVADASDGEAFVMMQGNRRQVVFLNNMNGAYYSDAGMAPTYLPVSLKAGAGRPKALTEFRGVVAARVLTLPEALFTIDRAMDSTVQRSASASGVSCTVQEARSVGENSFVIKVSMDVTAGADILNVPVQIRGRLRPFVRIQRDSGDMGEGMPQISLADRDGKAVRLTRQITGLASQVGKRSYSLDLYFTAPATVAEGVRLTATARRPATVEMPFTLQDVPLP